MTNSKPTNPKDVLGSKKAPLGLVPDTAIAEMTFAFLEGATKYGRYNWRIAGVSASIYHDAARGHLAKWWNGQDRDPDTRVRELASVMACCAILIDAELCGKLTDDRPPSVQGWDPRASKQAMELVAHLKHLFKDHAPRQYTIADTQAAQAEAAGMPALDEVARLFAGGLVKSAPGVLSAAIPEIRCTGCRELVTGPHTCVVNHEVGKGRLHFSWCTLDTDHAGACRDKHGCGPSTTNDPRY
jgi:hypothetical protein